MPVPRSWDLFCRVVDNYGDAAVCWRLAQRLAELTAGRVRLWIDNLTVLQALQPDVDVDAQSQTVAAVEIRHWIREADFGDPSDIAVDAFGGGLPDEYAEAMATRLPASLWIVLEYLSAEPWVATHHGLPSPHPRLPLKRYFFFPGFLPETGGVLREPDLAARRSSFLAHPTLRDRLWAESGFPPLGRAATLVTLFGYENGAVAELLGAWSRGPEPVVAAVPLSRLSAEIAACVETAAPLEGKAARRGNLEVRFLPFLSQARYDELLWASDWNFVRGEDSFVRAQWAERPFVWHLYPQADGAHHRKMEAFLEAYCAALPAGIARPLRELWMRWNGASSAGRGLGESWGELSVYRPALAEHAHYWAIRLANAGDMAEKLAKFCFDRLK